MADSPIPSARPARFSRRDAGLGVAAGADLPAGLAAHLAAHLTAVDRPIAAARGLPNAAYTAAEFHRFERAHLFARAWTALAFCADHATPGRVTPVDFMGWPLLIACARDGRPAVFHNVCSHRGRRLVDAPKTTGGLLVCPYHAWAYDLSDASGRLKSTPHIGGVGAHQADGFCRAAHGLKSVRSHCWLGVLFIDLSGDAPAFEEYAAPLVARYRPYLGAAMDGGAAAAEALASPATDAGLTLEADCNWKLAVENYCEAYHLPWIHPSLNDYSPLQDHYAVIVSEDFAGQGTRTFRPALGDGVGDGDGDGVGGGDGDGVGDGGGDGGGDGALPEFPDWPAAQRETAEYPVFYPNLLLGFQVNHFFALIIRPLAAGRIREEVRLFYTGDGAHAARCQAARAANLAAWTRVFSEDISAVEGMQRGRQSPGFGGGVFSPAMDAPTHHFHRWVARKYRAALGDGGGCGDDGDGDGDGDRDRGRNNGGSDKIDSGNGGE